MARTVNYSGLVVAGLGFFLTRFTVTLALYEDPVRFYLAGVFPLVLGLGLAAFGVALTVADVEPVMVRKTAAWSVIGAGTMFLLVLLTLLGSTPGVVPDFETIRSQTYLSNFLIGGSVGGTLTGLYAAHNYKQRAEIRQHADQLAVLNRLLRHEVLNSVTAIQGYNDHDRGDAPRAREVIREKARAIERTIETVKHLVGRGAGSDGLSEIELEPVLRSGVASVTARYPDADVSIRSGPPGLTVLASPRLEQVIAQLVENAVAHGDDPAPVVEVTTTDEQAKLAVRDSGPGLPRRQQVKLETGEVGRYDDPGTGFGLDLVRLFIDDFGGSIETDVSSSGTTVTLELARADRGTAGQRPLPRELQAVRPAVPHLLVTLVASLLAGVAYGIAAIGLGGSIAGIGVFYGSVDPVVGWFTHEFHSVVFGFVYAGVLTVVPDRYRARRALHVAAGVAWAVTLWVVAAGVVAPVWLRLLGIPAPIPSLSGRLLVTHLVWGVSLGVLTQVGYAYLVPRLADGFDRIDGVPLTRSLT